tara:strand:- start:3 stop:269 length:267 start_codon:yes stop_codon:yes gene_type:complete
MMDRISLDVLSTAWYEELYTLMPKVKPITKPVNQMSEDEVLKEHTYRKDLMERAFDNCRIRYPNVSQEKWMRVWEYNVMNATNALNKS